MAAANQRRRKQVARMGAEAVNGALTPRQRKLKARKAARIRWEAYYRKLEQAS